MKDINDTAETSEQAGLASRSCKPCESGGGRLTPQMIKTLMNELPGDWKVKDGGQLEKSFEFPDFQKALDFTNSIGRIAEEQGHHPDIFLSYGEVRVQLSTHSAGGLTENDFILAAKINELR